MTAHSELSTEAKFGLLLLVGPFMWLVIRVYRAFGFRPAFVATVLLLAILSGLSVVDYQRSYRKCAATVTEQGERREPSIKKCADKPSRRIIRYAWGGSIIAMIVGALVVNAPLRRSVARDLGLMRAPRA